MADVSIALNVKDNLSSAIVGMRSAVSPFRNDMTALQKELNTLNATKVSMRMDLTQAKTAAKDAQKAFERLGESATEAERAAGKADWKEAEAHYENIKSQLELVSKQARQTEKDMLNASGAISQADNRASRAAGNQESPGMMSALGKAGLIKMGGDVASQWANILVSSSMGQEMGSLFSGALSGAASGAALGSLAGLPGMAIGGLAGGVFGVAGSAAQVYEQRNDAFKGYVQEAVQGQLSAMQMDITEGSAIAAKREMDAISFDTLLGEGIGQDYLKRVRAMAANTPMEYEDLTNMSRALATGFKDNTDRMVDLMTGLGNAGSAVGVDPSGMAEMAKAMSRMQSSGKATLEYLNIFQERGVDAIGMIAEHLDTTKGNVYELISRSKLGGIEAVNAIEAGIERMYAGAMEKQSQTFAGLSSTLSDAKKEMQNFYGEGFNDTRKKGLQDEINFLSGESAAMIQDANKAMGAWQANLENSKEQYIRDAMQAVLEDDNYKKAMASGTDEGYAEAGRMLMEAKVRGMNEYNASDGAQLMLDMEEAMAANIRDHTASNQAYWDAGYQKGQWYSKGFAAALDGMGNVVQSRAMAELGVGPSPSSTSSSTSSRGGAQRKAFGMRRVPFDNFPILAHAGERLLTASEARSQERRGGDVILQGGNYYVREEADIDRIAIRLAEMIKIARMAGVGG